MMVSTMRKNWTLENKDSWSDLCIEYTAIPN